MTAYESVIILNPTLNDDQAQTLVEDLKRRFTEDAHCEVRSATDWGIRQMAFDIQKRKEGRYIFMRLAHDDSSSQAADFREIEQFLRFTEAIVRHMIVRVPEAQLDAPVKTPDIFTPSHPIRRGPRPQRPVEPAKPAEGEEKAEGEGEAGETKDETAAAEGETAAATEGEAAATTEGETAVEAPVEAPAEGEQAESTEAAEAAETTETETPTPDLEDETPPEESAEPAGEAKADENAEPAAEAETSDEESKTDKE